MKYFITVFIILALTLPAFAQQDIFLKVGNFTGESQDKLHSGWIDVYAYSGGASQSGSTHVGGGGGAGKANFQDYTFTLCLDKSINPMKIALAKGTRIPQVQVEFRASGESSHKISEIIMTNVIITSIIEGTTSDTNKITFNVSFNFAEIKCVYYDKDGQKNPIEFNWNIAENHS